MRHIPLLVGVCAALALGACAQPARWEKPQTSAETAANDLQDCRLQAQREALRAVGPYPMGFPFYGPPYSYGWRAEYESRLRQEQYFAENRLTSFCMRNKGYERVAIDQPKQ